MIDIISMALIACLFGVCALHAVHGRFRELRSLLILGMAALFPLLVWGALGWLGSNAGLYAWIDRHLEQYPWLGVLLWFGSTFGVFWLALQIGKLDGPSRKFSRRAASQEDHPAG